MPRVFVVEPDAELRRSLADSLIGLPVELASFSSAEALVEKLPDGGPLCIVTEVALPGMSGLELLELLKTPDWPSASFIFIAALSDVPTAVRALKAGALDFLEKPVVPRLLRRRVRQALGLPEEGRR